MRVAELIATIDGHVAMHPAPPGGPQEWHTTEVLLRLASVELKRLLSGDFTEYEFQQLPYRFNNDAMHPG